jgi:hypothetical protein
VSEISKNLSRKKVTYPLQCYKPVGNGENDSMNRIPYVSVYREHLSGKYSRISIDAHGLRDSDRHLIASKKLIYRYIIDDLHLAAANSPAGAEIQMRAQSMAQAELATAQAEQNRIQAEHDRAEEKRIAEEKKRKEHEEAERLAESERQKPQCTKASFTGFACADQWLLSQVEALPDREDAIERSNLRCREFFSQYAISGVTYQCGGCAYLADHSVNILKWDQSGYIINARMLFDNGYKTVPLFTKRSGFSCRGI